MGGQLYGYTGDSPVLRIDPTGLVCAASFFRSPIGPFYHTCIQVEWDEIQQVLKTTYQIIGWTRSSTEYTDYCGCKHYWEGPSTPLWRQTQSYVKQNVHLVYSIELVRGATAPQGGRVLGSGQVGALGVLGEWSIQYKPGRCSGQSIPIIPTGDPCALVRAIINAAATVGATDNGRRYTLFNPNPRQKG